MSRPKFEHLTVYQLSERLADQIWEMVLKWNHLARDTVGKQLIRSADSIVANIAEGTGRGTHLDNRRFVRIAHGSVNETIHWLRRAYRRQVLTPKQSQILQPILAELSPRLGAYHRSITPKPRTKNKEPRTNNGDQT